MVALSAYEADTCGGCNGQKSETTVAKPGDPIPQFEVPPPIRCYKCEALAVSGKQYQDAPNPQALLFKAVRKENDQ